MKIEAYIHSLKDKEHDRHVLGEAEIIKSIGDNLYLAEYNGGIVKKSAHPSCWKKL